MTGKFIYTYWDSAGISEHEKTGFSQQNTHILAMYELQLSE